MNKKINTQKIAYAALFVAVSAVLNCLSAQTTALSLSLTYIPSIIAGIYMGPFVGFLVEPWATEWGACCFRTARGCRF